MTSRSKGWNCYFVSAQRWFLWSELAPQFSGSVVLFGRMECDVRRSQIIQNATLLHASKLRRPNIAVRMNQLTTLRMRSPHPYTRRLCHETTPQPWSQSLTRPTVIGISQFFFQLIIYFCLLLPFSCNIVVISCHVLSIQRFLFGFLVFFHNRKPIFIVSDLLLANVAAFKCHFYQPNLVFHITGAQSLFMEEYTVYYISLKKKKSIMKIYSKWIIS